jgi:signal transduction histidine kinase
MRSAQALDHSLGEADHRPARRFGTRDVGARSAPTPSLLDAQNRHLRARIEQLEHEKARLEDFAAMAAHELLMPLIVTEASATAIRENAGHGLDLDSRRQLDSITRLMSRTRLFVDALLAGSRDSSQVLRRERVDLDGVVRDCLKLLGPQIEARRANVEVDPLPVVEGNAALLGGVFSNLVGNALKFAPAGGSEIRIAATRSEAAWVVAVEAPGPAIPASERESIFEPWRRGRNGRHARGSGLGLAIVRQIVERHGGRLGVVAARPGVNRFFFTLPF